MRSGQDASLSEDIGKEMFSDPRVLGVVAGLLGFLAIVPGMPTVPFVAVGLIFGSVAYFRYVNNKKNEEDAQKKKKEEASKVEKLGNAKRKRQEKVF